MSTHTGGGGDFTPVMTGGGGTISAAGDDWGWEAEGFGRWRPGGTEERRKSGVDCGGCGGKGVAAVEERGREEKTLES